MSDDRTAATSGACELCAREVALLTKHHLIPRARHRNRRNKRTFDRDEVRERVAWLCRPCHKQVHALIEEKTLERDYNTIDRLRSHAGVARFVDWVRRRPDGAQVTTFHSNEKGPRRRAKLP